MDRYEFQELAKVRLKEANALLAAGLYDGAYYLAGYAAECALEGVYCQGHTKIRISR
jgi:HEPN domain-containing protein